jgi:hypothetical protein
MKGCLCFLWKKRQKPRKDRDLPEIVPIPSQEKSVKKEFHDAVGEILEKLRKEPSVKFSFPLEWENIEDEDLEIDVLHLDIEKNVNLDLADSVQCSEPANLSSLLQQYKGTIKTEKLQLWSNYWGGTLFSSVEELAAPVGGLNEYCENDPKASPGIKNRLRIICQTIRNKNVELDRENLLIMLAAHGGVCNVQKEIGIRMAYAAITDSIRSETKLQSIENEIMRILLTLRQNVNLLFQLYF